LSGDADPLDARGGSRLEHIRDYPTEHYPQFAQSTVIEIYETIRSLKTSPRRGRIGREEGTRELVFTRLPYIVAYRVKEDSLEVLHICHGAQDRP
jgi:toxin ParE1/3/4